MKKRYIIDVVVISMLLSLSNTVSAKWKTEYSEAWMRSHKSFELCISFLAYLNRQEDSYHYALGLKPDPAFKGFSLPTYTPIDKAAFSNSTKRFTFRTMNPNIWRNIGLRAKRFIGMMIRW